MVAMSSTTGASSPGRDRERDRVGAEQRLGAAPHRHVVGARDHRIDADHAVRERHRRIDAGGAGVVRAPRADPADAARRARARSRSRRRAPSPGGPCRCRRRPCAVAGAVFSTRDIRARIDAAACAARRTYCGSRNTPWASAPVRSASRHQLGHLAGVGGRQPDLDQRILDQAGNRLRGHALAC